MSYRFHNRYMRIESVAIEYAKHHNTFDIRLTDTAV